jgi:hypothetical protein
LENVAMSGLSVAELIAVAKDAPEPDWTALYGGIGLVSDAADEAERVARLVAADDPIDACWHLGILQTIDVYESARRRGGVDLAAAVFTREPPATESARLDAAFAGLAEWLATRDGWEAPGWTQEPGRFTSSWLADRYSVPPFIPEFSAHGIQVNERALSRA